MDRFDASPYELPCGLCRARGRPGTLVLVVHGRYHCDTCNSEVNLDVVNELPRILAELASDANRQYPLLRDPLSLGTPHLRDQFRDIWLNLLLKKSQAAIILMSVFAEALVKEIIFVQTDHRFRGEFGPAISHCERKGILTAREIRFLRRFKNDVRNMWLHQDLIEIAGELQFPYWEIQFPSKDAKAMLEAIDVAQAEIRAGIRKPKMIKARDHPAALDVAKAVVADGRAREFYEALWDFTLAASGSYLASRHYEDHIARNRGKPGREGWA